MIDSVSVQYQFDEFSIQYWVSFISISFVKGLDGDLETHRAHP